MKINLQELYKQTLEKNKLTPQLLSFGDFLNQVYVNLQRQGNTEGAKQVEQAINDSVRLFKDAVSKLNIQQIENLREYALIEKMTLEKRIEALTALVKEKSTK